MIDFRHEIASIMWLVDEKTLRRVWKILVRAAIARMND